MCRAHAAPQELPCSSRSNQTSHRRPSCCFLPQPLLQNYFLPALGPRGSKIYVDFLSHCLQAIFCTTPASVKCLLQPGSSGESHSTTKAAQLPAAPCWCFSSAMSWVTWARDRASTDCSLPPCQQQLRNTPAPRKYPHLSPGNMLRQSHSQRYLPKERWASSAGKAASQQREDKVVALEIIISTAIEINPLAAESRQETIVPRGTGRTGVSLQTDAASQTATAHPANNIHKHRH